MRALLAICLFVSAPLVFAANPANAADTVKGAVLEAKDVGSYTYLRLKTQQGETWAAVSRAPVKLGQTVTLENVMVMHDFESKTLKKTFPKILFGTLSNAGGTWSGVNMAAIQPAATKPKEPADSPVAKAVGANAKTVAEIVKQSVALKDKPVLVRGKVVKVNAGIMGKNWLHLRDGSGSAADGSNDILVTTAQLAKVADVVSVKGIVRINKDFGGGYAYKVLLEDATLQPQ